MTLRLLVLIACLAASACLLLAFLPVAQKPAPPLAPAVATEQVGNDPDDPAIWVHPKDPSRSLILGTNKVEAPAGALVVFGLDGKIRQTIKGLNRPNNVDVEYGLPLSGRRIDIAVITERYERRLRVYQIDAATGTLSEIGLVPVFAGEAGEAGAPMGIALYRRPRDGAIFAVVGRKTGPKDGYLWQYRLEDDGKGRVKGTRVRAFGRFSGTTEIEAVAVDDAAGFVYYADEADGIHKYHADPDHPGAAREVAHFGRDGFKGDREGIAIYARGNAGYVLCTDQIIGGSPVHIFTRDTQNRLIKVISTGADETDGLEVTSAPLGPRFPKGIAVMMNSSGKNFLIYRWEDIAEAARLSH